MNSFYLKSTAAVAILATASCSAIASDIKKVTWPTGWLSPLGTQTVQVNTVYGAFSLGCKNADVSYFYSHYLNSGYEGHLGLDLHAVKGAKVRAIGDGEVISITNFNPGYAVRVLHRAESGTEFTVVYGHVNRTTNPRTGFRWSAGDVVFANETIGTIFDNHLHIGLAPGSKPALPGFSNSSVKNGICTLKKEGTTDPISYLNSRMTRVRAELYGGIVGWKDNGSITSWLVEQDDEGNYVRYWVPDTDVYWCLREQGSDDWGARPARFLDQLPDQWGEWAECR